MYENTILNTETQEQAEVLSSIIERDSRRYDSSLNTGEAGV